MTTSAFWSFNWISEGLDFPGLLTSSGKRVRSGLGGGQTRPWESRDVKWGNTSKLLRLLFSKQRKMCWIVVYCLEKYISSSHEQVTQRRLRVSFWLNLYKVQRRLERGGVLLPAPPALYWTARAAPRSAGSSRPSFFVLFITWSISHPPRHWRHKTPRKEQSHFVSRHS